MDDTPITLDIDQGPPDKPGHYFVKYKGCHQVQYAHVEVADGSEPWWREGEKRRGLRIGCSLIEGIAIEKWSRRINFRLVLEAE